jgi:Tfp pilus assembly protein PilP
MRILTITTIALSLTSALSAQDTSLRRAALLPPPQADTYAYQPDGRRDPFMSLINGGADAKSSLVKDGIRTFTLAEISVRGIMQSRTSLVAMVQGPDDKTYLIHQGDKLADAVVKNVTAQGLIVMQDVSDPLSVQKQREVRKLLRSLEGTEK